MPTESRSLAKPSENIYRQHTKRCLANQALKLFKPPSEITVSNVLISSIICFILFLSMFKTQGISKCVPGPLLLPSCGNTSICHIGTWKFASWTHSRRHWSETQVHLTLFNHILSNQSTESHVPWHVPKAKMAFLDWYRSLFDKLTKQCSPVTLCVCVSMQEGMWSFSINVKIS